MRPSQSSALRPACWRRAPPGVPVELVDGHGAAGEVVEPDTAAAGERVVGGGGVALFDAQQSCPQGVHR
jgi:hypothetical protein